MKKLIPLMLSIMMSFSVSSQSLIPKVQVQNKDTLFCFTIPQSKVIAKHLENSTYCDSVLTQTENEVELLNQLQAVNDSSILVLTMKTGNQQHIINNQEGVIQNLNTDLKQSEKKYRNERWQKRLFAAGTFIFAALAILK
ncbi:MAG: hypothetical protein Q7W45_14725 [Bacteroidota bacterium]|nr:hypothetical protein [Bacteroidota bacterium]MDP3147380.1 hypothetical protein [Bacteroidota bacterium]